MTKRRTWNDMRGVFGGSIFTLLLTVLFVITPQTARSHAYPDHSDPKVGAAISSSPAQVRIWFDSDLEAAFSRITIQDGDGKEVDKGNGHVDGSDPKLLTIDVPSLGAGSYRVLWSVVGRDGHRTEGEYRFTIK